MILEICANSYQSALNAQSAGAHRIELCSELSVGGITPSFGLIKEVIQNTRIPVFVLIRPRSGDFCYSDEEFEIMKSDIQYCKEIGCSGIVSGVLTPTNEIDLERTQALIELSKPLAFTFHRAFDCVANPTKSLEQLISLGADRVLTSGQKTLAIEGLDALQKLNKQAADRIIILPGSGINATNAAVFKNSRFLEIHTSASVKILPNEVQLPSMFDTIQTVSDIDCIKNIVNVIN
ncbi:copper homeostasis protein CutC [Tenacibaculum tangerinum]|uniref:PF03932 family protein CutC n=1 Tax=Tenacibaculum tangerinum TaxID=3038772 RepID=A0ABY8L6Q5_9FLAO|nr:copper homeostasis protein CutC [Tenacibaculum tangerinum]WGH76322.1 copper homeostasis protein CutC [Tenacibaculum tangerinum]